MADTSTQQATFLVNDKEKYDKDAVSKVIDDAGFQLGKVLEGP